jgi:3-oxo-5alpha-steroid 4-dehydrogenase
MANELAWDDEADVIVVGFGGAGVCAAIEAAGHGSRVLVIERFTGGGATRISGGVAYAGGGSVYQKQAGFDDTPENMFGYLETEVKDAVTKETLQAFCEQSCDNLAWLEAQGVCFDASFCPFKTSYPPARYYLYYSGNESFPPHNAKAIPAPRGHRVKGKGLSGGALFERLKESALKKGVEVRCQSTATRLIVGTGGRVAGIEMSSIPPTVYAPSFTDF